MYFPYLRGRQYELIALRELLKNGKLTDKVIPVIEPVKFSPTLVNTLEEFKENNKNVSLILNPQVGTFKQEYDVAGREGLKVRLENIFMENNNLYPTSLMTRDYEPEEEFIRPAENGNQIIICKKVDDLEGYNRYYRNIETRYNFISESSKLRREVSTNRVKISDNFSKLSRNTDYADYEDEFFSDDHKYFRDDDYKGFSDYSIVGEEYSESGFAPYAVAIHIVYFDDENNLRIHHFVSDSNLDPSNPAGKFEEALSKLVEKVDKGMIQRTEAINELERLYQTKSYPGLGTVKKLSIMHHIELIGNYLDGGDKES